MTGRTKALPNTESIDNYLKAIFALGGPEQRRVTGKELAAHLQVAPASVTNMLQKLAGVSKSPVDYELHRGVRLSAEGKKRALEIVRHHRLIETFLFEVLDYPLEEVHDEAERLEHFISERFEERIAAKLGHPEFDPHGHCIPALDGKMPDQNAVPLSDLKGNGPFVVASLGDRDSKTLGMLRTSGIRPGIRIEIKKRTPAGHLRARIGTKVIELSLQAAHAICVRPPE